MFAVTIVIHKARNLIGILGSSEFGPKKGHKSNLCFIKPPSSRQRAQGNKGLQVISLAPWALAELLEQSNSAGFPTDARFLHSPFTYIVLHIWTQLD